jgi:lysophospholipase L1-like esterase
MPLGAGMHRPDAIAVFQQVQLRPFERVNDVHFSWMMALGHSFRHQPWRSVVRRFCWIAFALTLSMIFASCSSGRNTAMNSVTEKSNPKQTLPSWQKVDLRNAKLGWSGRVNGERPILAWTASRLEFRFRGTAFSLQMKSLSDGGMDPSGRNYFNVLIDGQDSGNFPISAHETEIARSGLSDGEHVIAIEKATEAQCGRVEVVALKLFGELLPLEKPKRSILFFGNSITAGYGIEDSDPANSYLAETQNGSVSYAGVVARELNASRQQICISGRGLLRNFDGGKDMLLPEFVEWTAPQDHSPWKDEVSPDVVVIEIGTNDFALGDPGELAFVLAYQALVKRLMGKYPGAKVVVVDSPMLTDGWPIDPKTRKPVQSASLLRGYIRQIRGGLTPEYKARFSTFEFTPQGADVFGYGADYHPNRTQAQCNGEELAQHLRKVMAWK